MKLCQKIKNHINRHIVYPLIKKYFKKETFLIAKGNIQEIHHQSIFQHCLSFTDGSQFYSKGFEDVLSKAMLNEPYYDSQIMRYRVYVACVAAHIAESYKEGDFCFIGVSWGVTPKAVEQLVDYASNNKICYLIDCWDGSLTSDGHQLANYCSDVSHIQSSFNDPYYKIIQGYVPFACHGVESRLAFIHLNTGDVQSEVGTISLLSRILAPRAVMLIDNYDLDGNARLYDLALETIMRPMTKLCLPNGQLMVFM